MSKNVFNPTVKMVNSKAIAAEIAEAWITSYSTFLMGPGVIALGGERLARGSQGNANPLFTLSAINDDSKKALFKSLQDELDFYTTIMQITSMVERKVAISAAHKRQSGASKYRVYRHTAP